MTQHAKWHRAWPTRLRWGWLLQIDVSGQHFVFPALCACCCGPVGSALSVSSSKSNGQRVVHTKTNAWDFPYCDACVGHVRETETAKRVAWTLLAVSVIVSGILWVSVSPYLGIPAGILAVGGTIFLYKKQMAAARGLCCVGCACIEKAVAYLGWHSTLHQFEIASLDYALAFMVANQRKLVNLSNEARELLESSGNVPPTGSPRAARRHRS